MSNVKNTGAMTTEWKLPGLPFPLVPDGTPACEVETTSGGLRLTGRAGSDLFIDPANDPANDPAATAAPLMDAGRLVGVPPAGDFTLSAKVTVGFASQFDAGVLLVHCSERRWAKLCFEYSPQSRPTAVTVVTRDWSDDSNSFEVDGNSLRLRITRSGRAWAFHASTDGSWWRLLRYFSLGEDPQKEPASVGFVAQSPTGKECTADFDDIVYRAGAPENLRDGS
jgi:uncharacterized protein